MKLGKGSSALFTVGIVLFQEECDAEACRVCIQGLRPRLGMKLSGKASEFHFRNTPHDHREAFLRAVEEFPFQFFSCTIDKQRLSGKAWHKKEYMYRNAGFRALDQAAPHMLEAELLFDATSSKKFDWEFLRFLKKHAGLYEGVPVIKETGRLESHKDDLIQMIDMVCGAVLAEDRSYHRLIRRREGGRVIYPPVEEMKTAPESLG